MKEKKERPERMHKCTKCKKDKTKEEMSKDSSRRSGISSWCKECRVISSRKWSKNNPEKARISKEKSKPSYLKQRNSMLKHRYGIDLDEFERMKEDQNNSCGICGKSFDDMTYHPHVDHCHESSKVRGLLCSPCNHYIGCIKDDPQVGYRLAGYLAVGAICKECHKAKTADERELRKAKPRC